MFTEWITSQIDGDEELAAKVVPDHPATGKRTLQDNGSWLKTLTRDNVELVRCGIARIEPDAVVDTEGRRHPADVLIYATGFRVNDFLSSLRITGRDGRTCTVVGATNPPPTSASRSRASRTSSACTDPAPTWPAAGV